MGKVAWTLVATILAFPMISVAANEPSTVTMPLQEYLDLKKAQQGAEFTSIETVAISGEYRGRLEMKLTGGASLPAKAVTIMDAQANVDVTDCRGSAVLLSKNNQVQLIPQEKRFQLTCTLKVKNWDEVRLRFSNVLSLTAAVKGVEPMENSPGSGDREVVLYRVDRQIASETDEEPSAIGYYKIQMLPNENRFEYRLTLHNPNSKAKTFNFPLVNKEVIEKIQTQLQHKNAGSSIAITLPPGDQTVRITGRLPGEGFSAPIGQGIEYVLLDQHPLLTSKVDTTAKRISAQDTKMAATFPAPRGFLFNGKMQLNWKKQLMETYSAMTYTIRSADYRYYWSPMGKNLVEATFSINNQGATEIPLTFKGTPMYLEINGIPQVLSKSDKDQLILRVPTGNYQTAIAQYQLNNDAPRGIASITETLPRPETTMSNVTVNVSMPRGFRHLFASNGIDQEWPFETMDLVWALLAFLLVFKLLKEAQIHPAIQATAAVGVGVLTFFHTIVLIWTFIILSLAYCLKNRAKITRLQPRTWLDYVRLTAGVVILLGGVWALNSVLSGMYAQMQRTSRMAELEVDRSMPSSPSAKENTAALVKSKPSGYGVSGGAIAAYSADRSGEVAPASEAVEMDGGQGEDRYQGLPAKIEIPNDGYSLGFHAGILDAKTPIEIKAVVFPVKAQKVVFYFALVMLLTSLWFARRSFWRYVWG